MGNNVFTISSGIISVILCIMFFTKEKINGFDNKIYRKIIVINLLTCLLALGTYYSIYYFKNYNFLVYFFSKCLLVAYFLWSTELTEYVYMISIVKNNNGISRQYTTMKNITIVLFIFLILITPINFSLNGRVIYTYGLSANLTFLGVGIYWVLWMVLIIRGRAQVFTKKIIPVLLFLFFSPIIIIIQKLNPSYLLLTFLETLVTFIMYHTIENPDVKMLEQLSMAKEVAEKANHAKSDFLSNMSHEIRTPLNAIVGFSESLKDDKIPEESREKVNDIIMASNNLLEIVNGILDISKIEANKLEIINKEYDIKILLEEIISLTKVRIGNKSLDFKIKIDDMLPQILYGDAIRIKQILLNILTNAVKYTKEGAIEFCVSSIIKDNVCRLIFSVEDTGIGIKEESLSKLFSKFERLDVEKELTIEGTGLGLAITKKLVDLMNGKIIVQSVYGRGSKFTISIDQRIVEYKSKKESMQVLESKIIDANGAKILIVDDNDLNIKVASTLLKKYNFIIDSAHSGMECLSRIKEGMSYDLIFMDDMMPKMSGRQTLDKLKQIDGFKIPVISLTANAITGMKQEYLDFGFDDYLAKPIEKIELEKLLKKYVNQFRNKQLNSTLSRKVQSVVKDTVENLENNSDLQFSGKQVLLIENNRKEKELEKLLHIYSLKIHTVFSGVEAIEKVIESTYDLILVDEQLSDLDAYKIIENLQMLEGFSTPVILMGKKKVGVMKEAVKNYRFSGYLRKPVEKSMLEEILNETLH